MVEGEAVDDLSFEDAFSRLEETVVRLESGGLSIEDMVARFEEGMTLVKLCYRKLDGAQARVRLLAGEAFENEGLDFGQESVETEHEGTHESPGEAVKRDA